MSDIERRYYGCNCGSPNHYLMTMYLGSDWDDPDMEADHVFLYTGCQWTPLKSRVREMWNVLRGRPRFYAEVILSLEDVTALEFALGEYRIRGLAWRVKHRKAVVG